jgi:hypothetical protein
MNMRAAVIVILVVLVQACVNVGEIQRAEPVRTLRFTGSTVQVTNCLQQKLGGKVNREAGDRFVVYDSVKGATYSGMTHYAITVRRVNLEENEAEWRMLGTPSDATVRQFWPLVQECARAAKSL